MQYRDFGKTGVKVSPIGFGMMRLPADNNGNVDEVQAIKILRTAIDNGLNYVDTAFNYHGGNSEKITGKALLEGYRDKVYLATKAPTWLFKGPDDFDAILDQQLDRLQTDHIDMYLLHTLNAISFEKKVLRYGVLEKLKAAREAGKIKYIGFSFHDKLDVFKTICDSFDWDFCQIQLNYLDIKYQAGLEGLKYAADKGFAVSIMEPLRGGFLADVPAPVKEIFDEKGKSAVEWGFDYLWNMPEVSVVLSGMGTEEQVLQNIEYASRSSVGMLGEDGIKTIEKARDIFASYDTVPCTGCSYCLPCPKGVGIPYNFIVYNNYQTNNDLELERDKYNNWVTMFGKKASECVGCHACENICPQHLDVVERLKKVAELFEK
ncbi:MAG: aldo/keto reductase [Candidatus Metalachnospira sp.]|nr:aldo/keto reductase [Candidatus Metalachnospira sp.]